MHTNEAAYTTNNGQTLASVIREIRDEAKEFIQTRLRMAKSELKETIASMKVWLPLVAAALTLLATAYALFTIALVALVSAAFVTSPYRWFLSFLIVGLIWTIAGVICGYIALVQVRSQGTFPKRTVDVLKADGIWLQNEVKNHV
ncbi:MAG TPA: phage holin family protein [Terriglobales bacterium]|nr:phage holin family protein [Terriglobales bacterium]